MTLIAAAVLLPMAAVAGAGVPFVYEVPSGGPRLEVQRPPLFFAAPFAVRAGRVVQGPSTSSDEILGVGQTRVVVVASWCPACHQLLERLSLQQPQTAVILFLDDDSGRRGATLANAASIERYPLAFHLLRPGSGSALRVTRFPTIFVCSRTQCTPEARRRR